MIFKYFDKIYCISLPSRRDRREQVKRQFDSLGIEPTFIDAVSHEDGRIGLQTTLLGIFEEAVFERYHNILIFEDDVVFVGDPIRALRFALSDIRHIFDDRYDMLYLGGNQIEPCGMITPNLKLVHKLLAAHAVCYKRRMFRKYIAHLKRVVSQGKIISDIDISDVFLTTIQAHGRCFMVNPIIATQAPSYSDIEHKYVDYTNILC